MRIALVLLLALTATLATPAVACAEASSSNTANVTVGPNASGPTVSEGSAGFNGSGIQSQAESRTNQPVAPSAVSGDAGSAITFRPIPFNAIVAVSPPTFDRNGVLQAPLQLPAAACPPGQTGFFALAANGAVTGTVCVGPQGNGLPAAQPTPLALAQQASAAQPWPVMRVGANPGVGLTGLATWFWLMGTPDMPDATASAGPFTVRVHAALVDVIWDFGDGARFSSGIDVGRPFPAASSIRHLYEFDSFGRLQGFVVTAMLRYRVTYSVNGGPPVELGVKARPYSAAYLVNQLQPQAVNP